MNINEAMNAAGHNGSIRRPTWSKSTPSMRVKLTRAGYKLWLAETLTVYDKLAVDWFVSESGDSDAEERLARKLVNDLPWMQTMDLRFFNGALQQRWTNALHHEDWREVASINTPAQPQPEDIMTVDVMHNQRYAFEAWQKSRGVTYLDPNPTGTWGDEKGLKYRHSHIQAAWQAWMSSWYHNHLHQTGKP